MMRIRRSVWAIALCSLLAAAPPGGEPLKLKGPWQIDFGEDVCTLNRAVDVPEATQIGIQAGPVTEQAVLVLVQAQTELHRAGMVKGLVGIGDRPPATVQVTDLSTPSQRVRLFAIGKLAQLAATNDTTTISLFDDHTEILKVKVTELTKAMTALNTCRASLAESWGIDLASASKIASPAEPAAPISKWFSADDYPKRGYGKSVAVVKVLIAVSSEGKVSSCRVIDPSGEPEVDAVPCKMLSARARYRPARDLEGHAIQSYALHTFQFRGMLHTQMN